MGGGGVTSLTQCLTDNLLNLFILLIFMYPFALCVTFNRQCGRIRPGPLQPFGTLVTRSTQ